MDFNKLNQVGWREYNNLVGEIVNFDYEFNRIKKDPNLFILNDFPVRTDADALKLRELLTIKYTGDVINYDEGYNPIENPVKSYYWMRTPDKVDWYMNPIIKLMIDAKARLSDTSGKRDYIYLLTYYCDPTYRLPVGFVPDKRFKKLLDAKIPRGINKFYHHFDQFIDIWFNISNRRGGYKPMSEPIYDFIQKYRDRVFCKHLPMHSNQLFAIESNDSFDSMDKSVIQHSLDAVQTLTSLEMEIKELTEDRLQAKAWKVVTCMANAFKSCLDDVFLKKEGLLRKSNCGTTASFNSRAVIVSNQRPNSSYRHLIIPWGPAMVLFAQEMTGILIREKHYSISEIFHMRARYAKMFNQELYDIMYRFLQNHRQGGKPVILHRPPTLERGSHQGFLVPDVEKDPRINTFYLPNNTAAAFNADYIFSSPKNRGPFYRNIDRKISLIAGTP